jgi:hypothetical protein
MSKSDSDHPSLPTPGEWIGTATSSVLALSGHPLVAMLGQFLVPTFQTVWALDKKAYELRMLRGARTVQVATEELGCDLDGLHSMASESDTRSELAARVLEASARTVTAEEKVDALGRVLAMGLGDDARFDEALLFADALRDLEAPHIKILAEIHEHPQAPIPAPAPSTGLAGWSEKQIQQQFPELSPVIASAVNILSRHALIRDAARGSWSGASGTSRWLCTSMGEELLHLLAPAG